ncbi:MAG: SulP family inorganic anion transporter [Actinomycetota bacterium]|nr:MAG: SulP family inorganic anion transporter [Actinomycetota bacterium]
MRWLPELARGYRREWLSADIVGGVAVAALLVPQCMAYAELAGLPASAGFRAALPALVVYALVGSSRHLGVGPEPGTALLAATAVAPFAARGSDDYAELMAALAVLVGLVALAARLLRLSIVSSLLSRPILVGYLAGVGITLASSQLSKLTGIAVEGDRALPRFADALRRLDEIHWPTAAIGAGCFAAILVLRRLAPKVPGVLVAVAVATALAWVFDWAAHGVAVVGDLPSAFPTFAVPSVPLDDVWALLPGALGIAVVGFTDNVLTARSIGAKHGYTTDPDRELGALGATNVAAGLGGGFPVSSSASRSVTPASLGSHTRLVGLVAAATLLLALATARPALAYVPEAAIGAVILAAAVLIIDVAEFAALWRLDRIEFALAVGAALGVILSDVLIGVGVAVGLSLLVALQRIARPEDAVLGDVADLEGWIPVESGGRPLAGLLVYRFDAPLFFANVEHFRDRLREALVASTGEERWVVLDCEGVGSIDTTAVRELAALVDELHASGVDVVAVARANQGAQRTLRRARLLHPAGSVRSFSTINSAVRAYRRAGG